MNARAEKFTFQTRPTRAQNDAMVSANRARQYAEVQAMAPRQEEPCNFCAVPNEEGGMTTTTLLVACLAGLALWALYAAGAVLAIDYFGVAGLIGSILGAFAIVGAAARLGRFV